MSEQGPIIFFFLLVLTASSFVFLQLGGYYGTYYIYTAVVLAQFNAIYLFESAAKYPTCPSGFIVLTWPRAAQRQLEYWLGR